MLFPMPMHLPRLLVLVTGATCAILSSGCAVPGYPYSYAPYGAVVPSPPGTVLQAVPPPVAAPGIAVTEGAYTSPYVYAPAPALIAPTPFVGFGNGYWYGKRFWPYRPGCAFYGGRYYGGYGANYWRGGCGGWQGGHDRGGDRNWHR